MCLSLLGFIITIIIWKKHYTKEIPKLTERKEIQFADTIIMLTMLIEIFQYINIGPTFKYDSVTIYLSSLLALDLDKFITLKGQTY